MIFYTPEDKSTLFEAISYLSCIPDDLKNELRRALEGKSVDKSNLEHLLNRGFLLRSFMMDARKSYSFFDSYFDVEGHSLWVDYWRYFKGIASSESCVHFSYFINNFLILNYKSLRNVNKVFVENFVKELRSFVSVFKMCQRLNIVSPADKITQLFIRIFSGDISGWVWKAIRMEFKNPQDYFLYQEQNVDVSDRGLLGSGTDSKLYALSYLLGAKHANVNISCGTDFKQKEPLWDHPRAVKIKKEDYRRSLQEGRSLISIPPQSYLYSLLHVGSDVPYPATCMPVGCDVSRFSSRDRIRHSCYHTDLKRWEYSCALEDYLHSHTKSLE